MMLKNIKMFLRKNNNKWGGVDIYKYKITYK